MTKDPKRNRNFSKGKNKIRQNQQIIDVKANLKHTSETKSHSLATHKIKTCVQQDMNMNVHEN